MKKIKNSQISLNTTNNVYSNNKKNVAIKTTIRFKILRKATTCVLTGLIATATLFSTACTPQNANMTPPNLLKNTLNAGLITPRATDPTILTTESGLVIKYGNVSISPSLGSGKLAGYPYFTTNDGTKDYTWVIIGIGTAPDNSPAGEAILNDTNESLRTLCGAVQGITSNVEIPFGYALVIANASATSLSLVNSYVQTFSYANSTLHSTLEGYYTNGTFGLSSVSNSIALSQLTTIDYETNAQVKRIISAHVFLLGGTADQTFYIGDYGSDIMYIGNGANTWLRGCEKYSYPSLYFYFLQSTGLVKTGGGTTSMGIFPAFVMQL